MKENEPNLEILVSVIVPVYNVEEYLEECVNSIRNQSYKNLEIILVDDGSPDICPQICDSLAEADKRINVIHKNNGGLSEARNIGTNQAKGDYIVFVDSDDVLEEHFVEVTLKAARETESDIVVMPYKAFSQDPGFNNDDDDGIIFRDVKQCMVELLSQNHKVPIGAHSKLYKSFLCKEIQYPVRKYYEDLATTYKMILKANRIACLNVPRYGYRIRKNSIIREKFSIKKMDMVGIADQLYTDIVKAYPDLIDCAASRVLSGYFTVFLQIPKKEYIKEQDILWSRIIKFRCQVLFGRKVRTKAKVAALLSFLGKNAVREVFNKIRRGNDIPEFGGWTWKPNV